MGGKPGAVKIKAARDLADELELYGMALKKKFSPCQVEAFLEDDLGVIVKRYPDIVSYLLGKLQVESMTQSQDDIHSAEGGLSY